MPGGSASASSISATYTQPTSRTAPGPRSTVWSTKRSIWSCVLDAGPGMKLARTRKARAPSRRSRLAGWICPAPMGAAEEMAPRSISAAMACEGRMPDAVMGSAIGDVGAAEQLFSGATPQSGFSARRVSSSAPTRRAALSRQAASPPGRANAGSLPARDCSAPRSSKTRRTTLEGAPVATAAAPSPSASRLARARSWLAVMFLRNGLAAIAARLAG